MLRLVDVFKILEKVVFEVNHPALLTISRKS